ncbi:MAG: transcription antitermination factor NusB [Syntrophaceae bacterium]|nr:transcription antitermination factor NusB [Syntrophaceae bacterium]
MHQRRKAREVTLQVLYGLDVQPQISAEEAISHFWAHFEGSEEAKSFSAQLIAGAWNHREQIDELISGSSENWTMARMSRVDKSILRMAVYELLYCRDIPPKVTLNEAVDLGKIYGSENSGAFINGILDALYGRLRSKDENQPNDSVA